MGYDRGDTFLSISNQMEFHLVQNRMENCHHDHIPFNLKGNGNIVFSVQKQRSITVHTNEGPTHDIHFYGIESLTTSSIPKKYT